MTQTVVQPGGEEHARKEYPSGVKGFLAEGACFDFVCDNARLQVTVLTDRIVRFRYVPFRFRKDFSYALNPWFGPGAVETVFTEEPDRYLLSTGVLYVKIRKDNLEVAIEDRHGNVINRDRGGFHYETNKKSGGHFVYCTKEIMSNEHFYGLGDKPFAPNLFGHRFRNWTSDVYGFAKNQDPLYRSIPFYYGLHEKGAYGVFFDNSFSTWFDFGAEDKELLSFWAEGGEINYYFIYGPGLVDVAEQYVALTGLPELPPLWALGYHQSKWSYRPDSKVMEVARTFRDKKIPCDVIHLDIDYMDGFRCFTWNRELFPDPAKMIADLESQGFKVVTIIDPGIKVDPDYFVYKEAIEKKLFCRRPDGDLMIGKVWPGECCFPDFTDPRVRTWWGGHCGSLIDVGVHGIWNDMNEPAVFEEGTFPDDVRHDYDSLRVSHRRAHNVFGMQMARATYEGMRASRPGKRPFNLTRSGYSGVQRYAAVWTGDNVSSWEHLWIGNMQCQRMSISGVSFVGTDIGGFTGDADGELFSRYMQMAVFHPFFRGHSSSDNGDKEPWAFGEAHERTIRSAIELRYKLLPYIYTSFWQYVARGTPVIRPLVFIDQQDPEAWHRMDEFGFGDNLLVCPVSEPGASGRLVYLPHETWYDYWTGETRRGGREHFVHVEADTFPLFVREGAVIPHTRLRQFTGEQLPEEITLRAYYTGKRRHSFFYEDAGDGYAYTNGEFSVKRFTVFGNPRKMRLIQRREGSYKPPYNHYNLEIYGLPFRPKQLLVDGRDTALPSRKRARNLVIRIPAEFQKLEIR